MDGRQLHDMRHDEPCEANKLSGRDDCRNDGGGSMMVMVTSLQILRSDSMIKEDNSVSFCKSLADVESADLSF